MHDDTADTGLLYMRQRHYDPTLARFLSRDPIGFAGGLNLYGYVGGNPVNHSDPSGLEGLGTFDDPHANKVYLDQQANLAIDRGGLGGWVEATGLRAWGVMLDVSGATVAQEAGQGWGSGKATKAQSAYYALVLVGSATGLSSNLAAARVARAATVSGEAALGFSAAANAAEECPKGYVFRNLAPGENPSAGLQARAPGATEVTPMSHVAGKRLSPWISTAKTSEAAMQFTKNGFFGQVKIDLSLVTTEIVDISSGPFGPAARMLNAWARMGKEVLIRDFVPPEAIQWQIRP
ncbi:MAG: RHS repeat-associated core domain-containing protein [Vulcanimicrobiota bacterium]